MRFLILFLLTLVGVRDDFPWPDKSGPHKDGHVGATHTKGVVTSWDEGSAAWKTPLPEEGHYSGYR